VVHSVHVAGLQPARWVNRWIATGPRRLRVGEADCYWVRWDPDAEHPLLVYPGKRERAPHPVRAHFSINSTGVVREWDHPQGPSSVTYYVVRGLRVYPSEGHPAGPDGVSQYRVEAIQPPQPSNRVRFNRRFGRSSDEN
jgi:hypothetical protein